MKRTFQHPTANSTTITPAGVVLVFGGPITGKGDSRVVGTGTYETEDAAEISWLESLVASKGNQVTEIKLEADTGVATALVVKKADPTVKMAAADAAQNTVTSTEDGVMNLREKLAEAIKSGSAADSKSAHPGK